MNRNRLIMGIGAVTSVAALTLAVTTLPAMAGRPQHRPPTPPTHKVAAPTTSATYGYSLTLTGLPGSSAPLGISGTATIDLTGQQAQLTANLSRAIGPIGTTLSMSTLPGSAYSLAASRGSRSPATPWRWLDRRRHSGTSLAWRSLTCLPPWPGPRPTRPDIRWSP